MAVFPAEVLVELYGMLGDARDLLAVIAIATQALVIGAVLLAVAASLALRRRQLAVLRALGASRGYIFAAVWTHVSLMITAGAALGFLLGWAVAGAISALISARTGIHISVAMAAQECWMVAALIAVGMLLAAIPSWASYRHSVCASLRS
jgi:putative ABC transport system permease protein